MPEGEGRSVVIRFWNRSTGGEAIGSTEICEGSSDLIDATDEDLKLLAL